MTDKTYTDDEVREAMQLAEMLYPAAPPKGKKALSVLEGVARDYLRMKGEVERWQDAHQHDWEKLNQNKGET